ncbi:MAG: hypothetical protein MJZ62_02360 [Bacteroidales bacterium]|nr:hypothetical protein [Bacteroidales bacterium]
MANKEINPEKYIRTRARKLPIYKCFMNPDWAESGMATVMVVRQHNQGNFTFGLYLADTFCLGIKDVLYGVNVKPEDYEDILNDYVEGMGIEEVDYNTAHNMIYGAIAYAEEAGVAPCKDFTSTAQYILEEDTEEIPLIEFEYGHNGGYELACYTQAEANRYIPLLNRTLGEGNYAIVIGDGEEE